MIPLNPVERFNLELLTARMGHDVGDFTDRLWANAFGTGLGGPEGPEPQSVSALRAPSLSQSPEGRTGANNSRPRE